MAEALRATLRYGYFPFMFLGIGGGGVALILAGGPGPAWPSPSPELLRALGIVVLMATALAVSFGAERLLPYEPDWNSSHADRGRDVAHFLVNESMSLGPLLLFPLLGAPALYAPAGAASSAGPASASLWPSHWPVVAQAVIALVLFDLVQNLFHWASHTWKPLWRLHAVHHSVERMYGLNGILKHPAYQIASSVTALAPLVLLGMPEVFSLVIAYCSFVQLLLQHSNVDYRTGPIRRICSTAEVHRFHHLRGTQGDVNFALFFAFWDHLLGNAYYAPRRLATRDIGLDYADYPRDYAGQLVAPLREFELREGGDASRPAASRA